jgi:uncharacterized cupin superfamily protein
MPRIDVGSVPAPGRGGRPARFRRELMTLPPGGWSSQRHWHSHEDELVCRNPHDLTTCSDIDMMSSNADGRFVHKDGEPYPPW